ncbi:MAG: hypothetical protein AAGA03_01265 [Planctomycetota bacterium]
MPQVVAAASGALHVIRWTGTTGKACLDWPTGLTGAPIRIRPGLSRCSQLAVNPQVLLLSPVRRPKIVMSPVPTSIVESDAPGQLLSELEQRQDEVLQQLDELEDQINSVLKGLGVTVEEDEVA